MPNYTIGFDFGTESARAVLVEVQTGEVIAAAVVPFPKGVIDSHLPDSDRQLPQHWALQDPADWLIALEAAVSQIMGESGIQPGEVIGLGLDFTACTVLPVTADGTPLSQVAAHRQRPHAWTKLWKHHAAQAQADQVNALAEALGETWLARYGRKISSEWLMPKALEMLEGAPDLYEAAAFLVEGCDWVVWQLTGQLARNACAAGYKGTWHKSDGFPSSDFLSTLHRDLANLYTEKYAGPVVPPGQPVGGLTHAWAARLGLRPGTPVAAPIIDAHAAVLGGGITEPGVMFMIMGTSTCHLLMAEREVAVEGISGVVEDGIAPGLFGYEAGQAGVGDIFAWFVEQGVPPAYHEEAADRKISLHDLLSEKAARLRPGQSGLLALDWWNGCRSTLVDARLSGLLLGMTLTTKPEEIYRALIEATAFGTRMIIESFTGQGLSVGSLAAGGGLTRNPCLMQIYADVTHREIAVTGAEQASARGAAMLAAVAAGPTNGGHESITAAAEHMAAPPEQVYQPQPEYHQTYDLLYAEYRRLYHYFGRGENNVMKTLLRLRQNDFTS